MLLYVVQSFDDHHMKSAALEVFTFVLENSPSSVREFIMHESSSVDDVRNFYATANCSISFAFFRK